MIDNRKLLAIVTIAAVLGTLGLMAYSKTLKPQDMAIGDIGAAQDGALVRTTGTITDSRSLSNGAVSLVLTDMAAGTQIDVYLPPEIIDSWVGGNLVKGADIEAVGTVSFYKESPEITIATASDIKYLAGPGETVWELPVIMSSLSLFDGMEVATTGRVMDIEVIQSNGTIIGTRFSLWIEFRNESYSIECFCPERDLTAQHDEWDSVNVTGEVGFYENRGCWQITVEIVSPASA